MSYDGIAVSFTLVRPSKSMESPSFSPVMSSSARITVYTGSRLRNVAGFHLQWSLPATQEQGDMKEKRAQLSPCLLLDCTLLGMVAQGFCVTS